MKLVEFFIREAQTLLHCSTLAELAIKLDTTQASLSNWKSRDAFATFCGSMIENHYMQELSIILANAAHMNASELDSSNSLEMSLQNLIDESICTFGTPEEVSRKLEEMIMDELLNRLSTIPSLSTAKLLDNLIFIDSTPYRAGPFLFLYYTFHIIQKQSTETVQNAKDFILRKINEYKVFSLKNKPGFSNKMKKSMYELIDTKFSEEECQTLINNSNLVIAILERKMPAAFIKAHQKHLQKLS